MNSIRSETSFAVGTTSLGAAIVLVERLEDEVEECVDVFQEDTGNIVQASGELASLEDVGGIARL